MLNISANLSMLFKDMSWHERLSAAKAAGFRDIEIQFPYDLSCLQWKQLLDTHELNLVLINVPAGDLMSGGTGLAAVPGCQPAFKEAVLQAREYASALNVPTVNVLPGRLAPSCPLPDALQVLTENLAWAAEQFAECGIVTCFEAINTFDMPGFLIHDLRGALAVLDGVGHTHLCLQLDLYHMARMGEDLTQCLQKHIARIGHIQFADIPGRGAPGTGHLDFAHLFALIEHLPYVGYCGAEYRHAADEDHLGWWRSLQEKCC